MYRIIIVILFVLPVILLTVSCTSIIEESPEAVHDYGGEAENADEESSEKDSLAKSIDTNNDNGENNSVGYLSDIAEANSDIFIISNIQDYTIIYPKDSIGLERVSAYYLADYIFQITGKSINVKNDSSVLLKCEILIGDTNRRESQDVARLSYGKNDILIRVINEKIILYGKGLMVAGAMGQFANQYVQQSTEIHIPLDNDIEEYRQHELRNIILMIGDGLGFTHVEFAKANGLNMFRAELLPNKGSLLTECYPNAVADSAAAGTALSSGYKTRYTYIGVDKDAVPRQNIRELAYENGYKTAVVTTDLLTGATPAAFLAHVNSRYKTSEIDAQIVAVKENEGDMLYVASIGNNPMLDDIKTALKYVSTDSEGFFIMIEEEWIDYYAHYYQRANLVKSIERFDEAVTYAIAFTMAHPDTLLIVASDHETGRLRQYDNGRFGFTGNHDHTNIPVPIYAWGYGTEIFDGKETDNTEVARFIAKAVFGVDNFGNYG